MSSRGERSDQEDVLDLIGGGDNDNQNSDAPSGDEGQNDQNQGQGLDLEAEEDGENAARKIEPPTRKRTKSNVPRLNTDLLKGKKGVHKIEKYFEGFKYYGKGREKEDLDRIMKRMEHWCHRLFPKLNFDDCLAKVENLGNKKDLQVFLKRYRLGDISADDDFTTPEFVNQEDDDEGKEDATPQDEFDLLLAEQISKKRQNEADTSAAFDNLLTSVNPPVVNKEPEPELSDEVKDRIERNRKLALERKMATLKRLQELEAAKNNVDNSVNTDNSDNNRGDGENGNNYPEADKNDNNLVTAENGDNNLVPDKICDNLVPDKISDNLVPVENGDSLVSVENGDNLVPVESDDNNLVPFEKSDNNPEVDKLCESQLEASKDINNDVEMLAEDITDSQESFKLTTQINNNKKIENEDTEAHDVGNDNLMTTEMEE